MVDTYSRLAEISDERLDCMEASFTLLRRLKILVEKAEYPPELMQEFNEFVIDWRTNITKLVNLSTEQAELLLLVAGDMREITEMQIAELKGVD